jgi:hypothetical protein
VYFGPRYPFSSVHLSLGFPTPNGHLFRHMPSAAMPDRMCAVCSANSFFIGGKNLSEMESAGGIGDPEHSTLSEKRFRELIH